MTSKIPATVITGFLGAGKTSLVQHVLENANGKRIALIINEFGDIGIDGDVIKGCGDALCRKEDMIELANGCICCTVADDFIPTMEKLLDQPEQPDHIIIETSGLALPQPLVKAFNWPEIADQVTVDGVIAVVDGPALSEGRFAHDHAALEAQRLADAELDHDSPLHELFEDQLNCADMVLLNKTDLLNDQTIDTLQQDLRRDLRPGARLVPTSQSKIDVGTLLGLGLAAEQDLDTRKSHHEQAGHEDHDHDDFESFIVELDEVGDKDGFVERVQNVIEAHDILRLKGFAALAGSPARLVIQAVGPRINQHFDRPWGEDERRGTALVVIGLKGLNEERIRAELAA